MDAIKRSFYAVVLVIIVGLFFLLHLSLAAGDEHVHAREELDMHEQHGAVSVGGEEDCHESDACAVVCLRGLTREGHVFTRTTDFVFCDQTRYYHLMLAHSLIANEHSFLLTSSRGPPSVRHTAPYHHFVGTTILHL